MAAFGPPPGQPAAPLKKRRNFVQTTRTTSAFVLDSRAIQRDEFKTEKIGRLEELRQDHSSVICSVGRIVALRAVFVVEKDEASILDPVALRRSDWEQNPFGQT